MKKQHKKGRHLTLEERVEIYRLKSEGFSIRSIGKQIGRNHSVVSLELNRNLKVFLYVRDKLRSDKWTPEQIAGRLSLDLPGESISYETIYQYIYGLGRRDKLWTHLVRHHKKRKSKKSYKADEKKTRYTKLEKLSNKKANTKHKKMQKTLKMLQSISKSRKPIIKSVTYDNGSENAYHYKLSKNMKIKGYICHPYHSWEKGSIENVIGRVRRFIPKGTDITIVSDKYLQQVEDWINNSPLKCLNWLTPNEAMEQEVNKYKFKHYRKVLSLSGAFPN